MGSILPIDRSFYAVYLVVRTMQSRCIPHVLLFLRFVIKEAKELMRCHGRVSSPEIIISPAGFSLLSAGFLNGKFLLFS